MTTEAGEVSDVERNLGRWRDDYRDAQDWTKYARAGLRAAVLLAHERGIKPPRIAELVGLSRQSVHDILKKGER